VSGNEVSVNLLSMLVLYTMGRGLVHRPEVLFPH
jgi:hypothetical protein